MVKVLPVPGWYHVTHDNWPGQIPPMIGPHVNTLLSCQGWLWRFLSHYHGMIRTWSHDNFLPIWYSNDQFWWKFDLSDALDGNGGDWWWTLSISGTMVGIYSNILPGVNSAQWDLPATTIITGWALCWYNVSGCFISLQGSWFLL